MSTGAECNFVETKPGEWFYQIQQYPYGYTEEYDKYGPFPTFDKANDHLQANHANPGGHTMDTHPDHVHDYKVQRDEWSNVPRSRCTGCGENEPETLGCGNCLDYHRPDCDEYVLHMKMTITVKRARDLLDGEETIEASVLKVARSQAEHALQRAKTLQEIA